MCNLKQWGEAKRIRSTKCNDPKCLINHGWSIEIEENNLEWECIEANIEFLCNKHKEIYSTIQGTNNLALL